MYSWQFAKSLYLADLYGWTRFVSMQNHYNLLYREEEREMIPLCKDQGIAVIPGARWPAAALTRAANAETTKRSETDRFGNTMYGRTEEDDKKVIDRLGEIAEKRGVPRAQVALAWLLSNHPVVTSPIVGATKPHHLDDAVAALSAETGQPRKLLPLRSRTRPHPVLGFS